MPFFLCKITFQAMMFMISWSKLFIYFAGLLINFLWFHANKIKQISNIYHHLIKYRVTDVLVTVD